MSVPLARDPDSSTIKIKSDGGKVWEECWKKAERPEERIKQVREEIKRLSQHGMCQMYQILQPQHRKVTIHLCAYYEAKKKLSRFRKALIVTGAVTGVIGVVGAGIFGAGALGILAASKLVTVSGIMAGLGAGISGTTFSLGGFLPTGESVADYDRGKFIGSHEVAEGDEWQDQGVTYEQALGEPYPCIEKT